jgi:hypothetical protein
MTDLVLTLFESANQPTVMFDIDNTLNFSHNAAIGFLNGVGYNFTIRTAPEHFTTAIKPIDVPRYKAWKATPTAIWEIAPDTFAIKYVLWLLEATVDVMICSNHTPKARGAMAEWLTYWGLPLSPNVGGAGNKERVSTQFGPNKPLVWVDDSPQMIPYARPGVELALLDRVWTQTSLPAHVTLIKTMHDIDALIWINSVTNLFGGQ